MYSCKFATLVAYENACMCRYEATESKHADCTQSLPGRGECDLDYPVSLFIMDVANSSRAEAPDGLADYLDKTVDWMEDLTSLNKTALPIRAKHRFGDEIILVAGEFSTAYTLAFFIKQFWRYHLNPPYFGMTVGSLGQSVEQLPDLDRWLHPMINTARLALDELKTTKSAIDRKWMLVNTPLFPLRSSMEETNELLEILDYLLKSQSPAQKTVGSLYAVFRQQAQIASFLHKDPSTISRQLKTGATDLIIKIHRRIENRLDELQRIHNAATERATGLNDPVTNTPTHVQRRSELIASLITSYVQSHLEEFFTRGIR